MSSIHTIPLHLGDLITDTMHLSPAELGAYMRLLAAHYRIGVEGLPDDDAQLRRITGLDNKTWRASKPTVMEFFTMEGDRRWVHGRVQKVIVEILAMQEQNRAKALKRWKAGDAAALPEQCSGNATAMPAISHKPEEVSKKESKSRGTRFALTHAPDDWIDYCQKERPDLDALEVFQRFRDYWIAKAGRDGVKLDWNATWRNWVRNEKSKQGGNYAKSSKPTFASEGRRLAAKYRQLAEAAAEAEARGSPELDLRAPEEIRAD